MHDGNLDFLEILGRVFVDNDASKNPDADDDDDEPEFEEVHEWGCPGNRRKDVQHKIRPGNNFLMDDLMFELSLEPNFREYFCILCPAVLSGWE